MTMISQGSYKSAQNIMAIEKKKEKLETIDKNFSFLNFVTT